MSAAATAVSPMSKVMGGITTMFKGIGKAISSSLGPIGMLLDIFSALGIIQPIIDVLMSFVSILSTAFIPLLVMMLDAITPLIPPFQEMVTALTPVVTALGELAFGFGTLGIIVNLLNLALPYLTMAFEWLTPYVQLLNQYITGITFDDVLNFFKDLGPKIVGWVDMGIDAVETWFKALPGKIADWIEEAIDDAKNKIKEVFTW